MRLLTFSLLVVIIFTATAFFMVEWFSTHRRLRNISGHILLRLATAYYDFCSNPVAFLGGGHLLIFARGFFSTGDLRLSFLLLPL